jgi:hypothetical protein
MVDRIDLLIAVAGIVVSVVGSSTALWVAVAKKADKADLDRLESRLDTRFSAFESRFDTRVGSLESRVETDMARIEAKLDGLILRLVPDGGRS